MTTRRRANAVAIGALALLLAASLVVASRPVHAAGPTDDDVRRIAQQLACQVCQGESVADSQAELSVQMREVIREKLAEGETDRQILAYFIDRYGEQILLNPPKHGFSTLLWLGPLVVVGLGALLLVATFRQVLRRDRGREEERTGAAVSEVDAARYMPQLEQAVQRDVYD